MDLGAIVDGVLLKAAALAPLPRIPFSFGSVKSTGVSAIPKVLDMINCLVTPDQKFVVRLNSIKKVITLKINPTELTITPYVRIEEVKTGGGRTYFHWLDQNDRAVEAYVLTMKGTTGTLLPKNPDSAAKLYTYLKLRELTLEPYWFRDPTTGVKTRNQQWIIVRTIGLPLSIVFGGFYRKPIMLTENAAGQYNLTWDFEFIIEAMEPDFYTLSKLVGSNLLVPSVAKALLDIGEAAQIVAGGNLRGIGV